MYPSWVTDMSSPGVTPAYFRFAAREQISHYGTVRMINGTVVKIEPAANQPNKFTVYAAVNPDGGRGLTLTARKIILATGLRDVLPSTPGIAENWGKGIFWCPWCDGHEHADQELGLLGSLDNVPGAVREMLTLNKDIIAFVNGTSTPELRATTEVKSPGWEKYLRVHSVTVDNRTITGITRLRDGGEEAADPSLPSVAEHDLFRVDFTEGEPVERAAFLAAFPSEQTSKVGEEMGVRLYGGRLAADQSAGLVTNIPGVYAIGDANSDNVTNVPHALFSGKRTAVYLHGLGSLDLVWFVAFLLTIVCQQSSSRARMERQTLLGRMLRRESWSMPRARCGKLSTGGQATSSTLASSTNDRQSRISMEIGGHRTRS